MDFGNLGNIASNAGTYINNASSTVASAKETFSGISSAVFNGVSAVAQIASGNIMGGVSSAISAGSAFVSSAKEGFSFIKETIESIFGKKANKETYANISNHADNIQAVLDSGFAQNTVTIDNAYYGAIGSTGNVGVGSINGIGVGPSIPASDSLQKPKDFTDDMYDWYFGAKRTYNECKNNFNKSFTAFGKTYYYKDSLKDYLTKLKAVEETRYKNYYSARYKKDVDNWCQFYVDNVNKEKEKEYNSNNSVINASQSSSKPSASSISSASSKPTTNNVSNAVNDIKTVVDSVTDSLDSVKSASVKVNRVNRGLADNEYTKYTDFLLGILKKK